MNRMENITNGIKIVIAAIGGWIGWFLGGIDGGMIALICFMSVDVLTGIFKGIKNKKLSSHVSYEGLFKKVVILLLVGVGSITDRFLIGNGETVRTAVIFFYIANEGISLLENTAELGLPYPQKLKDVLAQLSDDNK